LSLPINDLQRHTAPIAAELTGVVARVIRRGWFVMGPELTGFESAFAAYSGVPHCVGVANGTDALELALRALGVGAGDRVVTVANAGGYSTTAIRSIGAVPHYIDIEPETMLASLDGIAHALSTGVRAVVVTHLFGRMVDMDAVVRMAAAARVPLVEDCAQAHGAQWRDRKAGTFGDAGCFSFYPTKNLGALGDGGALVTSNPELASRLRELRQYGWSSKYVTHRAGGRNSRLDELQAAALACMLPRLDGWNARRREIAVRYSKTIAHPAIRTADAGEGEYVAHLYVVRTSQRESLQRHLAGKGIGSDVHYPIPDHRQRLVAGSLADVRLPETEHAAASVLTLPCFPEMTDDEVDQVAAACNAWEA
jgi:dTDP-4-amino-4,6-dideoxygalactose transaminase